LMLAFSERPAVADEAYARARVREFVAHGPHLAQVTLFKPSPSMDAACFLTRLAAAEQRDNELAEMLSKPVDERGLAVRARYATTACFLPELLLSAGFIGSNAILDCSDRHQDGEESRLPFGGAAQPVGVCEKRNSLSARAARLVCHVKPRVKRAHQRRVSCGQNLQPAATGPALPSKKHSSSAPKPRRLLAPATHKMAMPRARACSSAKRTATVLLGQPATVDVPARSRRPSTACASASADSLASFGFRTLGPIASGAFSTILKAKHLDSGDDVAVKIFEHTKAAKVDLHMRDREIQALASIKHGPGGVCPWVANLLETHSTPSCTAVFLELCDGGSLQRHLQKLKAMRHAGGGPAILTEPVAATYATQLARALQHLHSHDVVHRDLKPANILLYAERHVKLCDFGFARVCRADTQTARCHTICGTPVYMAPELTLHAAVSQRGYEGRPVDVWAFGTVLYELHHNQVAFTATSGEQLFGRIRNGAHQPLRATLSKGWKEIIKACLRQKPTKRPSFETLCGANRFADAMRAADDQQTTPHSCT